MNHSMFRGSSLVGRFADVLKFTKTVRESPTELIAVMGAMGAVAIIFRRDKGDPAKLAAKEGEYMARIVRPFVAGARGLIDDVMLPHETRKRICRSRVKLRDKKFEHPCRRHENTPL